MSNPTCYIHPNIFATTTCDKCHNPICASDHRRYGNAFNQKLFCPPCYDKTKRQNKIGFIVVFLFTIVALSALMVFIYLTLP